MYETEIALLPSSDFERLQSQFNRLKRPYEPGEIVYFNLLYSRVYPRLSRAEKCHAEEFVDALVTDANKIGQAPMLGGAK